MSDDASLDAHILDAVADALIYATAERNGAELVTSDAHFKGLARVTLL